MKSTQLNILLADDDNDDSLFFENALVDFHISTHIITVNDGEKLMKHLTDIVKSENSLAKFPDVLFLDINMPRKNGKECLAEIKLNDKLKYLPVIMFSTSYEKEVVDLLFINGAHYFIRKPPEFLVFKKIIQQTIALIAQELSNNMFVNIPQPKRDDFVLTVQSSLTN